MRFFTTSDGARIAYRDEGEGTPLVLLHGLMAHGGFFREQHRLAERFRLIRIDLRGHGASAAVPGRPTVEQIAGDVADLAAALDLEGAIGVGWSMGATILWHASSRFERNTCSDLISASCRDFRTSVAAACE